jgi:hypothetical protein
MPTAPGSDAPDGSSEPGLLSHWVEEQAEALKFELGKQFPVPPTELHSPSAHVETGTQKLEEVLLGHETPTEAFLDELQALETAPPLSDEELARQALSSINMDGDASSPS